MTDKDKYARRNAGRKRGVPTPPSVPDSKHTAPARGVVNNKPERLDPPNQRLEMTEAEQAEEHRRRNMSTLRRPMSMIRVMRGVRQRKRQRVFTPDNTSNPAGGEREAILSYLKYLQEGISFEQLRPHWVSAFALDDTAMARETDRMLSVYGPTLPEQTRFLTTYATNLGLFLPAGLNADSYERADLLARIDLPAALATSFDGYDRSNVERVQAYGKSVLRALESDFRREGNPVHPWEALTVARSYGISLPAWVQDFLAAAADRVMGIREEVAKHKAVKREAERVGKALGFGIGGPGQGGWFKHATILQRDRDIYLKVNEKRAAETKLDFAYDEVAKSLGMTRSMVVRGYQRITKLNGEASNRS